MSEEMERGGVIVLNGFPGVGKLTIARTLQSKFPRETTRLVDNHLLIDPAEAIAPGRGNAHQSLRAGLRQVAFEGLVKQLAKKPKLQIIMTGCLAGNHEGIAVLIEHIEIAQKSNVPFYLVDVVCDRDEHISRFSNPMRYADGKTKLRDDAVLHKVLDENRLCDPKDLPEQVQNYVGRRHLVLNTTGLPPKDSATWILEFMRMC
ncbi:hypothetical protein BDV95DRAFT_627696 [Massariosphaeria phaeospora]|uniref:AAA domain-containing protein n=1 Tax=Massariosphaeria phaeospora TaxID=100035 RepID=A0A7C8ICM7_9PLEO|nr:hypothetical protein BDV95DRAFT_627696 [Massariosphaeria phaeospora]